MTRADAPIRLVLDLSALRGYLAETLHEVVTDQQVRFAVPAVTLAAAAAHAPTPGERRWSTPRRSSVRKANRTPTTGYQ